MNQDTKKRIQAYKDALPGLRERVVAVALLLVMSMAMMTSASFAWLTISKRPEVSGANTTLAANGNLEIALATGDGRTAPGASQVGDSSANPDQHVTQANITWGNLVNLSDSAYGLENLTLRPAQLNTASLLESPLFGAVYGQDGRITQLSSNFGFARWVMPEGNNPGYFGVSDELGVRAISSTTIQAVGAEAIYFNMVSTAKSLNLAAASQYTNLGNNDKYMPSLATMMGLYMTARMNSGDEQLGNPDVSVEDIQNLRDMYGLFLGAFDAEADAIAALINLQLFLLHGEGNYTTYTREMVYATTTAELSGQGITITRLEEMIKDRNTIASDYTKLQNLVSSGGSLKWKDSGMNAIVNNLVNVGLCTIGADNTPINNIGASNAMGYLSGTQEARITNGILYRFEERTGGYIEVKDLSISATVKRAGMTIPATVKANIKTTAPRNHNLFADDLAVAENMNDGEFEGGIPIAEDTYGLAVDLWVRTNAPNSYLTLEGNVLTETTYIRATVITPNGDEADLFTVEITETGDDGSTNTRTLDVYQVTEDNGTITWYNAEDHTVITLEDGQTPVEKIEAIETVIGFEGENRVWGENDTLSVDATTQGSGSCYVYYADTPEDQARSLRLLEAFNVAFVAEDGRLLATALMDTERYYAVNGRVIVPLVLDTSNSINLGEDYEGNVTYAIMPLEKNLPTRITCIVYLDGTKLTNDDVLAAADIQGQLNIQFGSSDQLNPLSDEELASQERRVSAAVDKASFDFDTHTGPMTSTVTITVDGDEPNTVTAFFLRAINATQGSREETMTFTKGEDGKWTASHTFTVPGNYMLRTVQLDGVDYDLETPPTVSITGFAIKSLSCREATDNHVNIMTAAASSTVNLSLQFATNDASKLPTVVQGRYLRDSDGSAVNVDFKYDPTTQTWTGQAKFISSGTYTLQYLLLDGEYSELAAGFHQTATVYLGMRVAVYTTSPHTFLYQGKDMADNEKLLGMQVKVMDNTGREMPGLNGVKLVYGMKGSGLKTLDADLSWNGSYYVGELMNEGPGIWIFSNVTVGGNVISNATTSPVFTIMSPEPPEYYNHNTARNQYSPNNNAVMNAQISNSSAAQVQAKIINTATGAEHLVMGTIGGEFTSGDTSINNWSFKVPTDANGYQDGQWQIVELSLWDVFDSDGSAFTEEDPLVLDISGTNNITKVVSRVYVSIDEDLSKAFGKDESGNVVSGFLDSHTISGLNINITDFAGGAVANVTDVQMTFTYQNGSSGSYGNYTSDQLNNASAGATVTVKLTDDGSGTHFVQAQDATILYAGNYTTTFSFKVSGTTYSYAGDRDNNAAGTKALPANAPKFTVWSNAPVVTVTGTNPAPGATTRVYSVSEPKNTDSLLPDGDYFQFSTYSAVVYIYTPKYGGTFDQEVAEAYAPKVTLKVTGLPTDATNVTMVFIAQKANSNNSTFTFTNGTATAEVGKAVMGVRGLFGADDYPECYPAGRMTQDKLQATVNGMNMVFTLANPIVIDQPQAPATLNFVGIPDSYTGTKPAQVPGNGTSIRVTLPTLTWTARIEEPQNGTWSAYTAVGEVTDSSNNPVGRVYGYRYYTTEGSCNTTVEHHEYQYYIWTKFQSSITAETDIYTQAKKITKWIINGQTYNAGATITVTGEGLINATAVVEDAGAKTFVETVSQTSYKYLYGYVAESSTRTSSNGGNQIGNTVDQNVAFPTVKIANPATANAATDTPGTNMTTDSGLYANYHP